MPHTVVLPIELYPPLNNNTYKYQIFIIIIINNNKLKD